MLSRAVLVRWILLSLAGLAVLSGLFYVLIAKSHRAMIDQHEKEMRNQIAWVRESIEIDMAKARSLMDFYDHHGLVLAFLNMPGAETRAALESHLQKLLAATPMIDQVRILDPEGEDLLVAARAREPVPAGSAPKPVFRMAHPVHSPGGTPKSVVFEMTLLLQEVFSAFAKRDQLYHSQLYILNEQGYWMHGNPELDWKFLSEDLPHSGFSSVFPEAWREIRTGGLGDVSTNGHVFAFSNIDIGDPPQRLYLVSHLSRNRAAALFTETVSGLSYPYIFIVLVASLALLAVLALNEKSRAAERRALGNARLAAVGKMASGIAHEINNPLAVISGRCARLREQVLSGTWTSDGLVKGLANIEAMTMRIAEIIRGLLLFAHGHPSDPVVEVPVAHVVRDAISSVGPKPERLGVRLESLLLTQASLECRPARLAQMLHNLLDNAIDAVRDQTEKQVTIEAGENDLHVVIRVSDNGHGVPDEISDRIMEPFFTTKPTGQGMGLGLSIAQGIIEAHQGRIWLDSRRQPTRFVIEIPKRQDPERPRPAS